MDTVKIVELVRLEESAQGTFGILRINKQVFCCTLEPADRENKRSVSSIPAQQYMCNPYESPTHGWTFQICNVPDREYILFHAGNTAEHTEGCILLGEHFGKLKRERAVLNSGATFARFLSEVGRAPFHLTIYERY